MMGTDEPVSGPGEEQHGGETGGAYPGETGPVGRGPSYSGYREGVYGEPVPDSPPEAPTAYQLPPTARQPSPSNYQPYQGYYPPPPGPPAQYPPAPYGVAPPYLAYPLPYRPTNGMAVAAMVLGILWLFWLGSLLALVFGYVSRQQIRRSGEEGDGMAVAGIVLGWIGAATFILFVVLPFLLGLAGSAGGAGGSSF